MILGLFNQALEGLSILTLSLREIDVVCVTVPEF